MTAVIQILDSQAANQIAAGEVVERPASVVKELVENALDAGAKHIDITIEGNGVPLIRVRDDGWGISAQDLELAVIRHATSKIRRIEDLDQLQTLGFRGEALPSIASIAHLEIISRPVAEVAGLCLTLNGGEQEEPKEVGCPVGTSVTVRDLFYNTPARLKFLKSTPTEFGLISDTVGRIALAHPEVSFSLTHPQQVVLQTSGRGDLRETIGAVLGQAIARQLIPLQARDEAYRLEGFISPPELVRSSKQAQTLMINGRIVRSPFLSRSLEEGYHTLIPAKLHPIAVLHLHVSPAEYDVNVHPTKMDVRFKKEQVLSTFISQAVQQTLLKSKPLPSFQAQVKSAQPPQHKQPDKSPSFALSEVPDLPAQTKAGLSRAELPPESQIFARAKVQPKFFDSVLEESRALESETVGLVLQKPAASPDAPSRGAEAERPQGNPQSNSQPNPNPAIQNRLVIRDQLLTHTDQQTRDILAQAWPLAQIFNTYILATDGETLLMIDQHAAHERINYERLLAEFRAAGQSSQALLIPLPMEFTLQEEQALLEHLWILNEMGFVLEQFGARTYLLRGVPVQIGSFPADSLLRQFIEEVLQKNSRPSLEKLLEEWIYLLACKESIKAQDSLSLLEMEQLMARLGRTQNPYTCPHGRPTMVKMTRSEVERRFYRN